MSVVLVAPEKKIQVVAQNSDYRRIAAAKVSPKPAQEVPEAQQAQEAIEDPGWRRERSNQGGRRTTYEPQIDEWKDHKELQARIAISLTPKRGKPAVGVVSLRSQTVVDTDGGFVQIDNLQNNRIQFPCLDRDGLQPMDRLARTFLPSTMSISLHGMVPCMHTPQSVPTVHL